MSSASIPQPVWNALSEAGLSSRAALLQHVKFTPLMESRDHDNRLKISYDDALASVITDDIVAQTSLCRSDILCLLSQYVESMKLRVVTSAVCMKFSRNGTAYVSSGCPALDRLLGGGFRRGEITEIFGKSGSGKTQLAINTLANLVYELEMQSDSVRSERAPPTGGVIIDTSHGFSPHRCAELLLNRSRENIQIAHSEEEGVTDNVGFTSVVQNALTRLSVAAIYDIYEMYAALEALLKRDFSLVYGANVPSLLVIDCVSTIFAPNLCKGYAAQASMETLGKMLRHIARNYGVAVIVTNNVVADRRGSGGSWKPALGTAWNFVPDRRLQLFNSPNLIAETQPSNATSRKHTTKCCIQVNSSGIYMA